MKKLFTLLFIIGLGNFLLAQTAISGVVYDRDGTTLPGITIGTTLTNTKTITNFDGEFTLQTQLIPPFEIEAFAIGYNSQKILVTSTEKKIDIMLTKDKMILDEIVLSASRREERILESPVTIETMPLSAIENSSAPTFYDSLENLKGVDVNVNSLTFRSINTRGFAAFQNRRFVQLIDGADNASPGLNFALGNIVGVSELDMAKVELLPGAASALYGANAFNGILFLKTKNPFEYEGVSFYAKTGLTSEETAGDNQYVDAGIRLAKAFGNNFAAKVNFSFLEGTDWFATDYRDFDNPGQTRAATNYNGLNIYGDEIERGLDFDAIYEGQRDPTSPQQPIGTFGRADVSRTGYEERDLTDYKARSIKADMALHFRNNRNMEIILSGRYGLGNTIFQDANRYAFNNFSVQQYKFELQDNHFFVRSYLTSENAGDTYDLRFAGINTNRQWKSDNQWFEDYTATYISNTLAAIDNNLQPNRDQIHLDARAAADTGRLIPGTSEFENAFNTVVATSDFSKGARFIDKTNMFHTDINYNFKELIAFAEIQLGGSFRNYKLNSEGTIFSDFDGPINFQEYGAYLQVQKRLFNDRMKFTGSMRYDQSNDFDGSFSPRVSLVYSLDEDKNHNLRASYQTGFRNPGTQDQYIGTSVGNVLLVGSAADNPDRITTDPIRVNNENVVPIVGENVQLSGRSAYDNALSLSSVQEFGAAVGAAVAGGANPQQAAAINANLLKQEANTLIQPEQVAVYELGYRGAVGDFSMDVNFYYSQYNKLFNSRTVLVPLYGDVSTYNAADPSTLDQNAQLILGAVGNQDFQLFQAYTNSTNEINAYGGTLGLATKIFKNYDISANYAYAKLDAAPAEVTGFAPGFNVPEHKVKLSFGNPTVTKNFGYNFNARWSDSYLWQSPFAEGIIDARTVLDAQLSYTIIDWKSTIRVGGANLLGKSYVSAPGAGTVGAQYYISWRTSL